MKNLNKIIITLFFCLFAFPNNANAQKTIIQGYIEGIETDTIFIKRDITSSKTREPEDTIMAYNGKFKYEFNCPEPILLMLYPKKALSPIADTKLFYTPDSKRINLFVKPNDTINLNGKLTKFHLNYSTKGSEICKQIYEFQKQNRDINIKVLKAWREIEPYIISKNHKKAGELYQKMEAIRDIIRKKRRDYIKNNPNNDFSAYLLISSGPEIIGDYLNTISPDVRSGMFKKYIKKISTKYENHLIAQASKNTIIGQLAPDFTLRDFKGKDFTLSKLKGKYVVLDFWASWCSPCIKGIPTMKEYHSKYKSKLEFVSIACNDKEIKAKKIVSDKSIEWLQLMNNESEVPNVSAIYSAESLPTKVIIDPKGKIIAVFKGESQDFYNKVDELMNK